MPNGHEPKTPQPPKCRACKQRVGVIGSRSLPASQRGSVRVGGKHYHPADLDAYQLALRTLVDAVDRRDRRRHARL